ncbi:tetratricopeptide repeat protein [Spiractinospora alimapuensis]|uniref:tetratricopeptide repeat protein n=1 Tax=Spiractinospora alimapuensis TaxID=2820884 RepID=UPI001F32CADB|nr:tetratricopeptide repeat protein [Spiractinospora alimapuensis]QVQ53831.1 tetratricopeptide repeat protein [Spiractinospora alimapuensis]
MAEENRNELSGAARDVVQTGPVKNLTVNLNEVPRPESVRILPQPDPKYANRTRELAACAAYVDAFRASHGGGLVLVQGAADIGKSAFLREAAHRHADDFSDVVHLALSRFRDDAGDTDYDAALDSVLRGLGVPSEERSRSRTRSAPRPLAALSRAGQARTILLTVDDVVDYGELRLLTRTPDATVRLVVIAACAAEFSGTEEAHAAGADIVLLEEFAEPDSMELLRSFPDVSAKLDRADAGHAADLIALCQGLPSVLRMVAAHLATQPTLGVEEFVAAADAEMFRDPALVPAEAVVRLGVGGLDPDQVEVLSQLAAYPGRFKPPEIAALVGEGSSAAVDALVRADLVRPTGEGNDVEMVELVQAHARLLLKKSSHDRIERANKAVVQFANVTHREADRRIGGDRLRFGHLLDATKLTIPTANHRLPFGTATEAAAWQDQHLAQVPTVMRMAEEELRQSDVALQLAEAVWPIAYSRGRWTHASVIFDLMGEIAAHANRDIQLAQARCYQARVNMRLGRLDQASAQVETARELEGIIALPELSAVVLETHGLLLDQCGESRAAVESMRRVLDLHRELGRARGFVLQTCQLADIRIRLGQHEEARAELDQAEALARAHKDTDPHDWTLRLARIEVTRAESHLAVGDADAAEPHAERARLLCQRRRGEPVREVRALRALEEVARQRGETENVRVYQERQRRIFEHYHMDAHTRELDDRTR